MVGEPIEDPKSPTRVRCPCSPHSPHTWSSTAAAWPNGHPDGRLDPPMTLVLDDVAAVAPLPQLPELLSTGADRGLPTLALLRSREQARARWPHAELPG